MCRRGCCRPAASTVVQVMREREGAAEFKARIEGLVHRYEAQHLPKRKRKLTTQQIRDMDEGALVLLTAAPDSEPKPTIASQ